MRNILVIRSTWHERGTKKNSVLVICPTLTIFIHQLHSLILVITWQWECWRYWEALVSAKLVLWLWPYYLTLFSFNQSYIMFLYLSRANIFIRKRLAIEHARYIWIAPLFALGTGLLIWNIDYLMFSFVLTLAIHTLNNYSTSAPWKWDDR